MACWTEAGALHVDAGLAALGRIGARLDRDKVTFGGRVMDGMEDMS